jgi:hypothetical protein
MAFKLQPGLILGGNLTLSPTGTPFIKDANWSKASTKPILVGVATNTAFASTSKYNADGSTVTGGTTIGGGVSSTTRWSSPLAIGVATNTAFASTSKYNADGSTVTGGATIGGGTSTTTRWSSPLEIGVTTNTAFASTSKYNADGSTVTGGTTIGGGTSTTTRWSSPLEIGVATNTAFASTSKYNADGSTVTGGATIGGGTSTTTRWSAPLAIGVATNTAFASTSKYNADGSTVTGGTTIGGGTSTNASSELTARYYLVSASGDDDGGLNKGSTYVYDANDPTAQPTKLFLDGLPSGSSLTSNSDKIFIGSWQDEAVYAYDANDLSATPTKLEPYDGNAGDYFGYKISASSDNLFVGSMHHAGHGAVYVYDTNDLTAQPTKLTAFDSASDPDQRFGSYICASSRYVAVGAHWGDDRQGAVYVFDATDLNAQPTKLTAFDGTSGDNARYGQSIAISSDYIVVGSHADTVSTNSGDMTGAGSAYVYDANDLTAQPTKITAFDAWMNDGFSLDLAITSKHIIMGAKGDDDNGSYSGSVYVFDATDLNAQPTKLSGEASGDYFGSVSATSDKILVGSPYRYEGGIEQTGAAYVYDANDLTAQPTKLVPFDATSIDRFGMPVHIVTSSPPVSVDWSAPLTIGVTTNTAFASTSKYDD